MTFYSVVAWGLVLLSIIEAINGNWDAAVLRVSLAYTVLRVQDLEQDVNRLEVQELRLRQDVRDEREERLKVMRQAVKDAEEIARLGRLARAVGGRDE